MKLACRWPDYRSSYADLLGLLTTLGDVEALGYQWQGQKDKTHNADRLLKQVSLRFWLWHAHQLTYCLLQRHKTCDIELVLSCQFCSQAADRFMHMLEDHTHDGPEHLVVFITSDQDFGEKITELQRRNFKVVVLYHEPHASQRPVSIINAADEAHDWLPFLRQELKLTKLSISDYDADVCQPSKQQLVQPLQQPTKICLPKHAQQKSSLPTTSAEPSKDRKGSPNKASMSKVRSVHAAAQQCGAPLQLRNVLFWQSSYGGHTASVHLQRQGTDSGKHVACKAALHARCQQLTQCRQSS